MEHEIIGQISALSRKEPEHWSTTTPTWATCACTTSRPGEGLWLCYCTASQSSGTRGGSGYARLQPLGQATHSGDYRVEFLARDVERLIGACGSESAAIVGHDWGGVAGWLAAMRYPEAVEKLAILNCPHPN